MRGASLSVIALSVLLLGCGDDGTKIVGRTEDEKKAARLVAGDHTAGNDGTEEAPSRVRCKRTGTSEFPLPEGQRAKGIYECVAKFPDGFTEDCEVDAATDEVGCVPRVPGGPVPKHD